MKDRMVALGWILWGTGMAISAFAGAPYLRLGDTFRRITRVVARQYRRIATDVEVHASTVWFARRRLWARLRGGPAPQRIVSVGGLISASVTGSATLTVVNATGDAAVSALQVGMSRMAREVADLKSSTAAKLVEIGDAGAETRTRDARIGVLGLALIAAGTVLISAGGAARPA